MLGYNFTHCGLSHLKFGGGLTVKTRHSNPRHVSICLAALAFSLFAGPAYAQDGNGDDQTGSNGDETEIVVSGRFLDTGAKSATKMDIAVLDTPMSVSAYTGEFLEAVETTNISDLYRYMTGVQRAGNTGYDITLRGFKTAANDRNAILTDGLPGLTVRFGSPPTVGVDHIEVVKGPTSVLYGQAQPGGFINIITKKPQERSSYEFALRGTEGLSSFGRQHGILASVDLTGPIDDDGKLLFRVVGEIGDSKGFRSHSYEKPIYFAPGLTWNIGPDTSLTLTGEYRKVRTHYDSYLVAPLRDATKIAAINTSYQNPSDELYEKGTIGNIFFHHEFSPALKLNASYRYVDHVDTAFGYDVVGFRNATTLSRRARGQDNKRTYSFADVNLSAKFDTFGIEHQLIFGGTIGKEGSDFNRLQFFNAPATGVNSLDIAVVNPVYNTQPLSFYPLCNLGGSAVGTTIAACSGAGSQLTWRVTTQKSKGAYISDLITLHERIKLMVGLRYADERQKIVERRVAGVAPQSKADNAWLPLAGLLFQPVLDRVTVYASYSTSYVPVAASNQNIFGRNPFRPTRASSIEGGVKWELLDKRLTGSFAVFDIKKKDTINTFSCPTTAAQAIALGLVPAGYVLPVGTTFATGTCSAELGGERSRGFELEVAANPVDGWNLTAGYAHINARVTKSQVAAQVDARLLNSPRDAFNIWSRYDLEDGPLKGLGFGLGVAYIGDRVGFLPSATTPAGVAASNVLLPLKSYTVVDLGVYYKISKNIDLTFKVSNLFDERYLESAGATADINIVPGQPRTGTLSLRAKF